MGTALLKLRLMPESPNSNLEDIEEKAKKIIIDLKGKNPSFEKEPIAFGLTALLVIFSIDESLAIDPFEEKLKRIKGVNSAETLDFRRAFG